MTRDQATKAAAKRWGKKAYIRARDESSSPEKRDSAMAQLESIKSVRAEIEAEIKRREVAAGIPELRQQIRELAKPLDTARWGISAYRFSVGHVDGVFGAFHIEGQGDTWEEAFAAVDRKAQAS